MKKIILIITALLFFIGCEHKKDSSSYTVQYYLNHKDLRDIQLKECKTMKTMTTNEEKNCQHANEALREPAKGGEMERAHNKTY